ncbi:TetR/AcrR family transcriptional regulator [Yinghuangia sp. ASG 101]|uniref:TetR/AcrR family transcriptional regulator n=1 Tax=Yinghuangia sp. ASG 101 TaxID=2896848 RepID=UPI001E2E3D12|nr:TetR/AcrR family transcriptional regulator [Yinghuangia sp. ASG 101]UGQ14843.1 TetR/AcrR family transcriptional regulator [Yinghuangia sp. ASG 101]
MNSSPNGRALPEQRPRKRDAAASRKALLDAARALFGERGYDRTTLRDIGERAGVDAALVARYYGNKAGLYLAAIEEDGADAVAARRDLARIGALADFLVARIDDLGAPGAMFRLALGEEGDDAARAEGAAAVRRAMVDPMVERIGGDRESARRRVEIAVASLIGLTVIRTTGFFPELSAVPREELVALVGEAFGGFLSE